jgi:hypothetical protein
MFRRSHDGNIRFFQGHRQQIAQEAKLIIVSKSFDLYQSVTDIRGPVSRRRTSYFPYASAFLFSQSAHFKLPPLGRAHAPEDTTVYANIKIHAAMIYS